MALVKVFKGDVMVRISSYLSSSLEGETPPVRGNHALEMPNLISIICDIQAFCMKVLTRRRPLKLCITTKNYSDRCCSYHCLIHRDSGLHANVL